MPLFLKADAWRAAPARFHDDRNDITGSRAANEPVALLGRAQCGRLDDRLSDANADDAAEATDYQETLEHRISSSDPLPECTVQSSLNLSH